jgi:hypothetical protein
MFKLAKNNGFSSVLNQFSTKSVLLILSVIFMFNLKYCSMCYITNCPWGGKRSVNTDELSISNNDLFENGERACRSCASGRGMCFGPRICCGPDIGCLMDSSVTKECLYEDIRSSKPCSTYGKACQKAEFGKCATKNLCCNPGKRKI